MPLTSRATRVRSDPPITYVRPARRWVALDLRELWRYRRLMYLLAWRDVTIRYRRTILGGVWAVLQPFLTMVVFVIVFGRFARFPSEGIPYPLFVYAALLPWQLFANALSRAAASMVGNASLLTKVYFPRLLIPLASALTGVIDFLAGFVVLIAMLVYYGFAPGLGVLNLLWIAPLAVVTALGIGLWLAALNVKYRDVGNAIPFLIQIWLYLTPVLYPSSLVPSRWRRLFDLNPMAAVVETFRWALLGSAHPPAAAILTAAAVVALLLVSGLYFFRSMEYEFADVV
jgi:lipopolysaccharide transport system permease protein